MTADPIVVWLTTPPGPRNAHVDPAVLDLPSQPDLLGQLAAADRKYDRPAVPAVFAEREALLALDPRRYFYLAEVEAAIVARYQIPAELHRAVAHEAYLAAGQASAAEMAAIEQAALAEGWRPITELTPTDGLRVEVRGMPQGPFRLRPDGRGGWVLLPRGARSRGYGLAGLVGQHRAFERAKARRQTAMDNPAVVMFREVT